MLVTVPENLDRFQVAIDPVSSRISIRGLGTIATPKRTDGAVLGSSTFISPGADFLRDRVSPGDILTIISGLNIGHYSVTTVLGCALGISGSFSAQEPAGQTFRVNIPKPPGGEEPNVSDGVRAQALYSFLKDSWMRQDKTLVGEAPELIRFPFPMLAIDEERFEIGGPSFGEWDFKDKTTRDLLRGEVLWKGFRVPYEFGA